jgi:hypothetical protein
MVSDKKISHRVLLSFLTYITGFFMNFELLPILCKLEKRGDEIFKKSSPLKPLSQSLPNLAEMILGYPMTISSKFCSY